jgi:hypothetical protein
MALSSGSGGFEGTDFFFGNDEAPLSGVDPFMERFVVKGVPPQAVVDECSGCLQLLHDVSQRAGNLALELDGCGSRNGSHSCLQSCPRLGANNSVRSEPGSGLKCDDDGLGGGPESAVDFAARQEALEVANATPVVSLAQRAVNGRYQWIRVLLRHVEQMRDAEEGNALPRADSLPHVRLVAVDRVDLAVVFVVEKEVMLERLVEVPDVTA